ncbi:hypothetical protein WISP_116071 [Willisornis vidua]|uniref:Uncharacterized protein n=1 Tax=Willisornis vidua TaxID=1566151 RepID=A0ABQ9CTW4_9PASS|nr:hypothetical protein WISP_116071 [Willisornis vidua]
MAPLMAHVIVLLSLVFATSSTQTDDFDNPTSENLNNMEVLGLHAIIQVCYYLHYLQDMEVNLILFITFFELTEVFDFPIILIIKFEITVPPPL